MSQIQIESPTDWTEYELVDSGDGYKLERFGPYKIARPDPRALWKKSASGEIWDQAQANFIRTSATEGSWQVKQTPPNPWLIKYKNLTFSLRPTEFKHVGVFPEQATNWDWLENLVQGKPLKVLNLFAYTGGATLAAAAAGATVTHVDSVKSTIAWARENAKLSSLDAKPIRWIEDDAYKFVLREDRRGVKYDGIIMDPPRFGRGSKGEVWKLEQDLPKLLTACKTILSSQPTFFLINAYTADLSSLVINHLLADLMSKFGGTNSFGELTLKPTHGDKLLPNGIFARWSKKLELRRISTTMLTN